ncbi:MAG: DUF2497 domain-containing protein [Hyphomicrobium sp.]|nr:DUF2497 domain-containing protein [Hyphomicrobium sp.]
MSRLESTAEPSMEEILASIRKIIAEDSSGLRSPSSSPSSPTSARTGAPFSPAARPAAAPSPLPQRGFMSREAFLKSSQPVDPEPEIKPVHTPSNPARSTDARRDTGVAPARAEQPSFTPIEKNDFYEVDSVAKPHNGSATRDSVSIETITIETISIETVAKKAEPIEQGVVLDAKPVEVHPAIESDAARIEAQLTELLSDDLNALREGRDTPAADAIVAKEKSPPEKPVKAPADRSDPADAADPFAFDLGPSPFARTAPTSEPAPAPAAEPKLELIPEPKFETKAEPKSEPKIEPKLETKIDPKLEPKPEPKIETKLEPKLEPARPIETAPVPQSPATQFEQPGPPTWPPYASEKETPMNGVANGSHAGHLIETAKDPIFGRAEPPAPVPPPKPRQTFAVPSVSATLGPSRQLEPLSNAFRPVFGLGHQEKPLPTAELAPEPPRVQEPVRAPEPAPSPEFVRANPAPSAAPALRSEANDSALHTGDFPPLSTELSGDRPMEDAVADLLRPLLKTWLAENMPKILERALRREMTERLLPGQKSPRE